MPTSVRVYRWDEIALEKVTEMISRKVVSGARATLTQVYLKRGAMVPRHAHEAEQMTYVLQGTMKYAGRRLRMSRVREGEVLHVPAVIAASGGSAGRYVRARRLQPAASGLARSRGGRDPRLSSQDGNEREDNEADVAAAAGTSDRRRALGGRHLQPPHRPAEPDPQRLEADRRPAQAAPRPDSEPRQHRQGRDGVRAEHPDDGDRGAERGRSAPRGPPTPPRRRTR